MGKILVGIIALVVGLLGGAMLGGAILGGAAAGIGVATGLSAGICATVQAAQEEGVMSEEQVDQVLTRAASDLGSASAVEGAEMVGSAAQCEEVMERLAAAAE